MSGSVSDIGSLFSDSK